MSKLLLFITSLLSLCVLSAQSPLIDSLRQELSETTDAELRYELYKGLARGYIYRSPDTSRIYTDSMSLAADELGDLDKQMDTKYNYSVIHRTRGEYADAIALQLEYAQYLETTTDTLNKARVNYQLGASHLKLDSFDVATDYLVKGFELAQSIPDNRLASQIANAIGVNFKMLGQYDKSLEYYRLAENNFIAIDDTAMLVMVYNGIGILHRNLEQLDSARHYFEQSLRYAKSTGNVLGIGYQYRNLGMLALKEGDLEEAEEYYLESLVIREQVGDQLALGGSYYDLGSVYVAMDRLEEAEEFLLKAESRFIAVKSPTGLQSVNEEFGKLYQKKGDLDKALDYMKRFYVQRDSLLNTGLKERVIEIEERYQSEQKDKQIIKKDLALEVEEKKKLTYLGLSGGLLITAILMWWAWMQSKKRKKQEILTLKREYQVKTLESLLEGEEKERQRIAKELHDGVNGDLSAIKFKLSGLLQANQKVIGEAISMIDSSCEQVRAISHNLTPPSLEKFALIEVLENYSQNLDLIHTDIQISYQHLGEELLLDKKVEVNLFRIVQEMLTNSLKHAEATIITVQTSYHNKQLHLTVEDNGKGFDLENIAKDGLGLQNIRSRVEYLGADMDFTSNDKGTLLDLTLEVERI